MPHRAALRTCNHWLAFELSVLRRLQFRSVALPWAGAPSCAVQLKRTGVRVSVNSERADEYVGCLAHVVNDTERLTAEEVARLTEDAYVPGASAPDPELRKWFDEPETWWFMNVRARAQTLETRTRRALALDLALRAGRYALSFDPATRHLRQPLSRAMRRLWERDPAPVGNRQTNAAEMQPPGRFLAAQQVDLAFIRLPRLNATGEGRTDENGAAWHDALLSGVNLDEGETPGAAFAPAASAPTVRSKTQYLHYVEDLLSRAAHLPQWAILHAADGFISAEELVEAIRHVRPVKTIYTKDFTEWAGVRACIVTA